MILRPEIITVAIENRRWLARVVRRLVEQGIDQFIDLGSGLPTQENVHQVAQALDPDARVVYVDHDPMVLAHARALLSGENTAYVDADISDPETVLEADETRRLIDFSRPVAVLAVAVLHFVADGDDPAGIVRGYVRALAPGSRVAITCASSDGLPDEVRERLRKHFTNVPSPLLLRPRDQIAAMFGELELEGPGVVPVTDWPISEERQGPMTIYGGIARIA